MVQQWLSRLGISIVRSPPVPLPKGYTPTWIDRLTAPVRRPTFTRHPDDPGNWDYPLQRAAFEQTQEDRARLTDWLNHPEPRVWHRIFTWPPRR